MPCGVGRVQGLEGGGSKGFGFGGVGGRGTGPRDGANFATCVVFLTFLTRTKRRKMFFEGCLVGGGVYKGWGGSKGFGSGGLGGRGTHPSLGLRCWLFQWGPLGPGLRGGGPRASVPGG